MTVIIKHGEFQASCPTTMVRQSQTWGQIHLKVFKDKHKYFSPGQIQIIPNANVFKYKYI